MNVYYSSSFIFNLIILIYGTRFVHGRGPHLITLNVKNKQSTTGVMYTKYPANGHEIFACDLGYLIKEVKKDSVTLCTAENKKYYDRVLIYRDANGERKLTVLMPLDPIPTDFNPQTRRKSSITVQLIDLNTKYKQSTPEVTYTKFPENNHEIFACASGYLIKKVMKDNQVLTTAVDGKYYDRVLIYRDFQGERKLTVLFPGDMLPEDFNPQGMSRRGSVASLAPSLTAFNLGAIKPAKVQLVELDVKVRKSTSKILFEEDHRRNRVKFTAKPGYLFSKVYKGDKLIWEPDHQDYIDRVVISVLPTGKKNLTYLFPGEIDMTEIEVIDLNVKIKETTDKVTYKKNNKTQREKFTCKEGYLFANVYRDGRLIHSAEDNDYFDRVIISVMPNGKKNINVLFPDEEDKEDPQEPFPPYRHPSEFGPVAFDLELEKRGSLQRAEDPYLQKKSTKTPVPIDLHDLQSTHLYEFKFDRFHKISTITAKSDYGFDAINHNNEPIWNFLKCKKSSDHPQKIIMKKESRDRYVAILFDNDYFVFRKHRNLPWQDLSDKRYDLRLVKFFRGDPNNPDSLVQLNKSDYTFTSRFIALEWVFNEGVECTEIRYNRHVMWRYVNKFPKSFALNLKLNAFVIIFSYKEYVILDVPGP